jgi:S-adenosylmethionine:tRNA ribosyltransferase-isomerase
MEKMTAPFINPTTLEFDLPDELIAQEALTVRDQARLLVVQRGGTQLEHKRFADLTQYLKAGDVLVLNRARVNSAKLWARKSTGGKVEVIFIEETEKQNVWKALIRPFTKPGATIVFGPGAQAELLGRTEIGENLLKCDTFNPRELMGTRGVVPLPPYIERSEDDPRLKTDKEDYQTVFASAPGSIAAPTAGLHFTPELIDRLKQQGVLVKEIVLNVGWGTFRPISGEVDAHKMLAETFDVAPLVFQELKRAKKENRRIIAVGTTVTRALESLAPTEAGPYYRGATDLFIKPGYEFKWISGLITNLHVPKSTPVALTAAFAGAETISMAYAEAVKRKYRFFSYGDAMLIL